jgi:RND family efflux transporter MFP subunit
VADQLSHDLASLRIQRERDPERRSRVWTTLLTIAGLAVLAVGAGLAYPRVEAQIFKTEVATTEIAMVSPAQQSTALTSTGYVVAQSTSKVNAKVPAKLARVRIREGDVVKAGDVIAELEAEGAKRALAAALARVAAARARASAARASAAEIALQVDRQRALVESGASGKAALDDLVARLRSMREAANASDAEVAATVAEAAALQTDLDDRTIVAPMNGTVLNKPRAAGELVGPQELDGSIAEIADFTTLMVEIDVPEARLALAKIGSPAEIVLDAYPSRRYRGRVTEIGKRVNRAKATVVVKVAFVDPPDGVIPDMSARASVLTEELSAEAMAAKPKRVVPGAAVAERGGQKVVFVIEDGKVKMAPIRLGEAVGASFELLEGPSEGTRVVSSPSPELADGLKVKEKGSE